MAKLKPEWVKTDIPKDIKIKLWRLMRDNPTYRSWEEAIVGKSYTTDQDKLFTRGELKYIKTSSDTHTALKYEIEHIPLEEVANLPPDLQSWVKQLRPELEKNLEKTHSEQYKETPHKQKMRELKETEGTFISTEATVTTPVGQAKLLSIELPTQRAILHQLKVWGAKPSQYAIQVCEKAKDYCEAELSTIYRAQRPTRGIDMFCRFPDIYYEDKDGGNSLHLEITPLLTPWDKLKEEITYTITVWFTPQ